MPLRLALLAAFPPHVIPGLEAHRPAGHYATWLPQLAEAFGECADLDAHWVVATRQLVAEAPVRWQNQTFHFLHVPGRLRMFRGYLRESRAITRRVRELDPDLVHAWGSEDCYALAGARCRRPWLLSMQGILREYVRRVRMHPLVQLQAMYEWVAVRRAREISAESPWACAVMQRLAPRARTHLVEYGVRDVFFETPWAPDPARAVAVFAGTPEPRKGIQDAVAAFADPRLAGTELHVAGDAHTAFATALRARASKNVRWLGRLSSEETAAAIARAWCLVIPTRADTGPMVVKEARVIGLPVISTPHGGQSSYITDGLNGALVEPGDIPALTAALTRVLGSFEFARGMGAARWPEQRDYFRPQRTAENFLKLYRELTTRSDAG
jgi:glycosyltransferase involved in cell wall biosynthesis